MDLIIVSEGANCQATTWDALRSELIEAGEHSDIDLLTMWRSLKTGATVHLGGGASPLLVVTAA